MRYAVLADIHGNLEALEAVLADASARTDGALCLGDVVGYGADPGTCLDLIGRRADAVVTGNHDRAMVETRELAWFNPYARAAAVWTRAQLSDDELGWLGSLPLVIEREDATLVHASPATPEEWEYLVDAEDGFAVFAEFRTRLCFVGHSHVPRVWSLGSSGPDYVSRPEEVELEQGRRYVVNVGSVGQPRDRDPRAAYAVWDTGARLLSIRRVRYDVERAQAKIRAARLPHLLADRLADGA